MVSRWSLSDSITYWPLTGQLVWGFKVNKRQWKCYVNCEGRVCRRPKNIQRRKFSTPGSLRSVREQSRVTLDVTPFWMLGRGGAVKRPLVERRLCISLLWKKHEEKCLSEDIFSKRFRVYPSLSFSLSLSLSLSLSHAIISPPFVINKKEYFLIYNCYFSFLLPVHKIYYWFGIVMVQQQISSGLQDSSQYFVQS